MTYVLVIAICGVLLAGWVAYHKLGMEGGPAIAWKEAKALIALCIAIFLGLLSYALTTGAE